MDHRAKIIDRIEKLFALYNGGAMKHESDAALNMAQKLMKKYNISDLEVNKNKYKEADRGGYTRGGYRSYHPSWDEYFRRQQYKQKQEPKQRKKRDTRKDRWKYEYYNETFQYTWIKAEVTRETEKAYLIKVHMDVSKYVNLTSKTLTISIWFPKSCILHHQDGFMQVKESLLYMNLKKGEQWLKENHPAFKGMSKIEFHVLFPFK